MIKQAVILAAGNGSRIQRFREDVPKPLRMLGGLTLIKRSILTAKLAGITDFIVVVGYKGEQIVQSLNQDRSLGVNLRFVVNPHWKKSNGLSLLTAKDLVQEKFLLMMADHVFDRQAVEKILKVPFNSSEVILGVDKNLQDIFDLEDVTKVQFQEEQIAQIGKGLSRYNGFDTGLFVFSSSALGAFEKICEQKEDVSLSEGVQALAEKGKAIICDLTGFFWQDVDTPEALKHAEKLLFKTLIKPTDGWISRNINRRISLSVTRLLIRTRLSANHVTGLVALIGILSGLFVSTGYYIDILVGGILFNLASILDGCDGELSKLKLTNCKTGEWLDTLGDWLTNVFFLMGVMVGVYHQHQSPYVIYESIFVLVGVFLSLGTMIIYLLRFTNSGSLVTIQKKLTEEEGNVSRGLYFWLAKFKFMAKRDFFALLFMLLATINQLQWILHLSLIGANFAWMVVLSVLFKLGSARSVVSDVECK